MSRKEMTRNTTVHIWNKNRNRSGDGDGNVQTENALSSYLAAGGEDEAT